jgi:maleate isomerase
MEHEFNLLKPRHASVHAARIRLREVVVSELLAMEKEIVGESLKLADAKVDVIAFGCTSGSLIRGLNHDKKIVSEIEKATGIMAVATAGAVVKALEALDLSKISVVTPYTSEINILERRFLEQNGFNVVKIKGLNITDNSEIGGQKPETIRRMAKLADTQQSQGLFISCTNLPTLEVIVDLEESLRKPVVSSNTATLWYMLKRIGHKHSVKKGGSLFRI